MNQNKSGLEAGVSPPAKDGDGHHALTALSGPDPLLSVSSFCPHNHLKSGAIVPILQVGTEAQRSYTCPWSHDW